MNPCPFSAATSILLALYSVLPFIHYLLSLPHFSTLFLSDFLHLFQVTLVSVSPFHFDRASAIHQATFCSSTLSQFPTSRTEHPSTPEYYSSTSSVHNQKVHRRQRPSPASLRNGKNTTLTIYGSRNHSRCIVSEDEDALHQTRQRLGPRPSHRLHCCHANPSRRRSSFRPQTVYQRLGVLRKPSFSCHSEPV